MEEDETDRLATSWASMGWEFPLRSLISFDMVDMMEKKSCVPDEGKPLDVYVYPDRTYRTARAVQT